VTIFQTTILIHTGLRAQLAGETLHLGKACRRRLLAGLAQNDRRFRGSSGANEQAGQLGHFHRS
jgi:hypothetical protein